MAKFRGKSDSVRRRVFQEEHTDWCVTFSCKVQLQKNCIMSGIHFLPYILCLFFKKDFEKPWRTSSRFVWFSEVLRFKATLRGDALLFWYASWSHTKSHLVTLTAIPITHRKWSGQKEYFTQNPKGRIWDLNRLRYFSDDAVFWLLHNYSRTFQITYFLCTKYKIRTFNESAWHLLIDTAVVLQQSNEFVLKGIFSNDFRKSTAVYNSKLLP